MFYRQFRELIVGLNEAGVRYLVVGGLAVIAHGYTRLTQDIDVILDLDDQEGLLIAITALEVMGYRPRAPVPFSQFADPRKRAEWISAKDMLAFSLYRADAGTELDLFISLPFDFGQAWRERLESEIDIGVVASFVDLRRLMEKGRLGAQRISKISASSGSSAMHHQERDQRRRQAQLPLKARLLWLDEALDLARRIQSGRRSRADRKPIPKPT